MMRMLSSIPLWALVLTILRLTGGYSWYAATYYASEKCAGTNDVAQMIMLQANKCYQQSSISSSMTKCHNQTENGKNYVNKTTYTWTNNNCGDTAAVTTNVAVPMVCNSGVIFSCLEDPPEEKWPGLGLWVVGDDGGNDECAASSGPQYIQTVPPTCQTDGEYSWKYECSGQGKTLNYQKYLSFNCSDDTYLTAFENKYLLGTCSEKEDLNRDGINFNVYAACIIRAIPGTNQLAIPGYVAEGSTAGIALSTSATIGIVIAVIILVVMLLMLAYYAHLNFHLMQRNLKSRAVRKAQKSGGPKGKEKEKEVTDSWSELRGDDTRCSDFCSFAFACTCCYEELG